MQKKILYKIMYSFFLFNIIQQDPFRPIREQNKVFQYWIAIVKLRIERNRKDVQHLL